MKNSIKISGVIDTTDASTPLGMEIWLDDQKILNLDWVTHSQSFEYSMPDDCAEHELRFVMKNKNFEHTKIDSNGNIVKDACLIVYDITFDKIKLGHTFQENAIYTHDFNGTSDCQPHKFYGTMGCNGTVSLKFSTPVYMWLLENM
jgi:hypothetical protein